jgi:type II secretory pathway pseudopilin PulG
LSRLRRDERGVTLVELLVASVMSVILLGAVAQVMTSILGNSTQISRQAPRISQARALMERLGREVRQAYQVDSASASQIVFRTYTRHATCGSTTILASNVAPTQCRVTYSCASGTCTRSEVNADGSGTPSPVTLVTGLQSDSVFTYQPSSATPDFVQLTLVMPGRTASEDAITLTDGFEMRNVTPIS